MNLRGYAEGLKLIEEINQLKTLLQESRDLLGMCTLIDKSGQCKEMVEKIDSFKIEP